MSVVSPVIGFLTSNTRFVATFQMLRNSKERRMVSILSGTTLWSRLQTRTGVKVPTSACASEPSGDRQNLAIKLVVGLAVDDHEARGVGQRICEERQERPRLAGAC